MAHLLLKVEPITREKFIEYCKNRKRIGEEKKKILEEEKNLDSKYGDEIINLHKEVEASTERHRKVALNTYYKNKEKVAERLKKKREEKKKEKEEMEKAEEELKKAEEEKTEIKERKKNVIIF